MHTPVLLNEMLKYLAPKEEGIYLDATFGAGGYSKAILESSNCQVLAIDRDPSVIKYAKELKEQYHQRFNFAHASFKELKSVVSDKVYFDGIVFDLGVSSMQLDEANRGFSFINSAPLDMRMDQNSPLTASTIVNEYSERQLTDIIFKYGDERKSRRIAKAIVDYRANKKVETTDELADIIRQAARPYHDKIDPSTRTFQAIRIEVNDELKQIEQGLINAKSLLKSGGKLLVVSFHSGEDTIVKKLFNEWCGHLPRQNRHLPFLDNKGNVGFGFLFKGVVMPSEEEIAFNSRSRSAKLRGVIRI